MPRTPLATARVHRATHWHRPLVLFAAATAALAVASAIGLVVDDRTLLGDPVWLKPFKFSVSFTVYALTLAWMLTLQTRHEGASTERLRTVGRHAGTAVALAGSIEMAIIASSAALGRRSHFNVATALENALFVAMGLTIIVLWVATLVIALLLARERPVESSATWALRLGCLIGLVGLALGGLMLTPTEDQLSGAVSGVVGAHSVGVPDGGPGMPVTGWSTVGGDLRIPHFIGMHALQLLPLLSFTLRAAAARVPRLRDAHVRLRLVLIASCWYGVALAVVTWQALRGQPLTRPDLLTNSAWAATTTLALLATALVLIRQRRTRPATVVRAGPVHRSVPPHPAARTRQSTPTRLATPAHSTSAARQDKEERTP